MKQFALFLAGGSGKRLWPLSRQAVPKQFITLPNGKTLLEMSLQRIAAVPSIQPVIVTTEQYAPQVRTIAERHHAQCLIEPSSNNTAAAIAWACRELRKNHENAVVMIMPTDHTIEKESEFCASLTRASDYVQQHKVLVLYGAPQTTIAPRFGFVTHTQQPRAPHAEFPLYRVQQFHEKPSREQAAQYYQQPATVWNMGIFVSTLATLHYLYEHYAPQIYAQLDNYAALTPIAFDHAILEKAHEHLVILRYNFGWSDVGSLDEFIPALHVPQKKLELAGAHTNSVITTKPVVLAGVSQLVVIELPDMILITNHDAAQSPHLIAQQVAQGGWEELI